jgi:hypothetical protein
MERRSPFRASGDSSRPNTKRTGEHSEAAFLLKATEEGFYVSKPWGDSERYDFIIDNGRRLWRVQLKCTASIAFRGYGVQAIHFVYGEGKVAYTADDIDVLVAYIIPKKVWYVLPVEAFVPFTTLRFYPDIECKRARWEKYREAWELLRGPRGSLNWQSPAPTVKDYSQPRGSEPPQDHAEAGSPRRD